MIVHPTPLLGFCFNLPDNDSQALNQKIYAKFKTILQCESDQVTRGLLLEAMPIEAKVFIVQLIGPEGVAPAYDSEWLQGSISDREDFSLMSSLIDMDCMVYNIFYSETNSIDVNQLNYTTDPCGEMEKLAEKIDLLITGSILKVLLVEKFDKAYDRMKMRNNCAI